MLGNRKLVLDCMRLSTEERQSLEADALRAGFVPGGLDKLPKPLSGEALHMNDEIRQALTWTQLSSQVPEGRDDVTWDMKVAAYAWHFIRERVDVWEPDPQLWAEYDPRWMMWMDDASYGGIAVLVYDTWLSVYELERYFLNPWLRCAYWVRHGALERHGYFAHGEGSVNKGSSPRNFAQNVQQPERWWAVQKGLARWGQVARSVPGAQPEEFASRAVAEFTLKESEVDRVVEAQEAVFSFTEFCVRYDELNMIIAATTAFQNALRGSGIDRIQSKLAGRIRTKADNLRANYLQPLVPGVAAATGLPVGF